MAERVGVDRAELHAGPTVNAGNATFTTDPSMNAMLEPRMVAARIHGPLVVAGCSHEPAPRAGLRVDGP